MHFSMQYSSGNPAGQIICWWLFQYVALMCAHTVGEQHKCVADTLTRIESSRHPALDVHGSGVKPDGGKTSLHMRPVNQLLFALYLDNCHAHLGAAWGLPHPVFHYQSRVAFAALGLTILRISHEAS